MKLRYFLIISLFLMAGCEPAPGVGIVNIRHSVELDLSKSDRYTGQITSDLELDNPRQDLALAFDAGVIEMVRLNGQLLPLNYEDGQIALPQSLLREGNNRLKLQYAASYSEDDKGLSRYIDPFDKKVYLKHAANDEQSLFPEILQNAERRQFDELRMGVLIRADWILLFPEQEGALEQQGSYHLWRFNWNMPKSSDMTFYAGDWQLWEGSYQSKLSSSAGTRLSILTRASIKELLNVRDWFKTSHTAFKYLETELKQTLPTQHIQVLLPLPLTSSQAQPTTRYAEYSEERYLDIVAEHWRTEMHINDVYRNLLRGQFEPLFNGASENRSGLYGALIEKKLFVDLDRHLSISTDHQEGNQEGDHDENARLDKLSAIVGDEALTKLLIQMNASPNDDWQSVLASESGIAPSNWLALLKETRGSYKWSSETAGKLSELDEFAQMRLLQNMFYAERQGDLPTLELIKRLPAFIHEEVTQRQLYYIAQINHALMTDEFDSTNYSHLLATGQVVDGLLSRLDEHQDWVSSDIMVLLSEQLRFTQHIQVFSELLGKTLSNARERRWLLMRLVALGHQASMQELISTLQNPHGISELKEIPQTLALGVQTSFPAKVTALHQLHLLELNDDLFEDAVLALFAADQLPLLDTFVEAESLDDALRGRLKRLVPPSGPSLSREPNVEFKRFALLRHAEKKSEPSDPELSDKGKSRANAVTERLWRLDNEKSFEKLYSSDYRRTRQTASPIADELKLEVSIYNPRELVAFAESLRIENKSAIVVGHSNTTPALVQLLGGLAGAPIPESEYERYYVIDVFPNNWVITRFQFMN